MVNSIQLSLIPADYSSPIIVIIDIVIVTIINIINF